MANFAVLAKIGANTQAYQKGINKAKAATKGFGSSLKGIGPAIAAMGLGAAAHSAINLGSKLSDLAEQLRISTDAFQTLEFAAREAGVQQSVLERALRNVTLRTQEAVEGNTNYGDAFKALGLNVEEFTKLPVEKRMEAIAKKMKEAGNSQEAFNASAIILGQRAGPAMAEILRKLADEGYDNLEKAAKQSGTVMTEETIMTMDQAADMIEQLKRQFSVLTASIITVVIPGLKASADGFQMVRKTIIFVASSIGKMLLPPMIFLGRVMASQIKLIKNYGTGFKAVFLAVTGQFKKANAAFKDFKATGADAFKDVVRSGKDLMRDLGGSFKEVKKDTSDLKSELSDLSKSMGGNISEATKKMTGVVRNLSNSLSSARSRAIDLGNTSVNTEPVDGINTLNDAATQSAATLKANADALKKLNEEKLDALVESLETTQEKMIRLKEKAEELKEGILEANEIKLEKLEKEMGATMEEIVEHVRKAFATKNIIKEGDLERAMIRAITNARSKLRESDPEAADALVPVRELQTRIKAIAKFFGEVMAQQEYFKEPEDMAKHLKGELAALNDELATLEQEETNITNAISELETAMEALKDATGELDGAMEDLQLPENLGQDIADGIKNSFDMSEVVTELKEVNSHLSGKFTNQ